MVRYLLRVRCQKKRDQFWTMSACTDFVRGKTKALSIKVSSRCLTKRKLTSRDVVGGRSRNICVTEIHTNFCRQSQSKFTEYRSASSISHLQMVLYLDWHLFPKRSNYISWLFFADTNSKSTLLKSDHLFKRGLVNVRVL